MRYFQRRQGTGTLLDVPADSSHGECVGRHASGVVRVDVARGRGARPSVCRGRYASGVSHLAVALGRHGGVARERRGRGRGRG